MKKESFEFAIKEIMSRTGASVLDAVFIHCEEKRIDFATIHNLISEKLRADLTSHAQKLNLLVKDNNDS